MSSIFQLSGLKEKSLELSIRDAVEQAGYSEQELADIRIPASYSMYDFVLIMNNLPQRLSAWQKLAYLKTDTGIPKERNIKARIKRILLRSIKWYIDPIVDLQSYFNNEAVQIVSELAARLTVQDRTIKQLREILDETRRKIV